MSSASVLIQERQGPGILCSYKHVEVEEEGMTREARERYVFSASYLIHLLPFMVPEL